MAIELESELELEKKQVVGEERKDLTQNCYILIADSTLQKLLSLEKKWCLYRDSDKDGKLEDLLI
jgi:hypothetical protein